LTFGYGGSLGSTLAIKINASNHVSIGGGSPVPSATYGLTVKGPRAAQFERTDASGTWADWPTSLPITAAVFKNESGVDVGVNTFTAIGLSAQGSAVGAANAWAVLGLEVMSATDHRSRLNLTMRGSGVSDYLTPWRWQYDGTTYWQTELSTSDITMYLRQGGTTVGVFGYDDSVSSMVIGTGTSISTRGMLRVNDTFVELYGSTTANLRLDASTSTANIYLQAASTSDSTIHFRQDSTTRFIMGYDDSADVFQIHSGTAFTTTASADFSIGTSGQIYMGALTSSTPPYEVRYNTTDGRLYYASTSDARLKSEIKPWKKDALAALRAIEVSHFFHNQENRYMTGPTAQAIQPHIPEMVAPDPKSGYLILSERIYYSYFHKAIQQLADLADKQAAEIAELKNQLNNEKS
jgi:hypothetical protein